jgi:hypothetical protein
MRKNLVIYMLVLILLLGTAGVARGINNGGELDGEGHPYVGLMIAHDANGAVQWRCTGTLMSPTLFLTLAWCIEPPAAHIEIWFDADVESGIPDNGYPHNGDAGGTPYPHPQYDPDAFYLYDLGVVILDEPFELDEYAVLPGLDVLDEMARRRGKQDVTFTTVGYGWQRVFPTPIRDRVRMVAYPKLIAINVPGLTGDYSILVTNNRSTGGTCIGDSGAPLFIGRSSVVGGIISHGLNDVCAGTEFAYRVDRADDLDWLYDTFGDHLP